MFDFLPSRRDWFRLFGGAVLGMFAGRRRNQETQAQQMVLNNGSETLKRGVFVHDEAVASRTRRLTEFTYDSSNRLVSMLDAGGNLTIYTYTYATNVRWHSSDGPSPKCS